MQGLSTADNRGVITLNDPTLVQQPSQQSRIGRMKSRLPALSNATEIACFATPSCKKQPFFDVPVRYKNAAGCDVRLYRPAYPVALAALRQPVLGDWLFRFLPHKSRESPNGGIYENAIQS